VPDADEETAFTALLDAAADSRTAARVVEETIGYLGAGFATLINLFNPERVVLGGWAGIALGERFLPEIRAATAEHALRQPFAQTSIRLCELGQDAVALGAATLPVARLLTEGGAGRRDRAVLRTR
jgi:predicted NBD/HSP70 family sugar kinase